MTRRLSRLAMKSLPLVAIALLATSFFSFSAHGQYAAPVVVGAPAAQTSAIGKAQQALEIAELAANSGMKELSFAAVTRSLGEGPPLAATPVQGINLYRSPSTSSSSNQPPEDELINKQVQQQVLQLTQLWSKKQFPDEEIYQTLAAVVLPSGRKSEVFLYPRPLTDGASRSGDALNLRSVGKLLARWAAKAGRTKDLYQRLEQRSGQPNAQLPCAALVVMTAMAEKDWAKANEALSTCAELMQSNSLQHVAELATHAALPALYQKETTEAALPVISRSAESLAKAMQNRWEGREALNALTLTLAQMHFNRDERDQARRCLDDYLAFNQQYNARYSGDYGLYQRQQQLEKVADVLVRAGEVDLAIERLTEASAIVTQYSSTRTPTHLLAPIMARLATMTPERRFDVLHRWCLPKTAKEPIYLLTSLASPVRPPDVFAAALQAPHAEAIFTQDADEMAASPMSTALALIEAAQQCRRLESLAEDLEKLKSAGVAGADSFLLLIDLARGRTAEAAPQLETLSKNMAKGLPKQGDSSKQIDLAHCLLAIQCLDHPELVATGQAMLKTLLTHTKRIQNETLRPSIRYALARSQALSRNGADFTEIRRLNLKHWQQATVASGADWRRGVVPPLWIEHEGNVRHIAGPEADFLFFKYPLTGSFDFHAEALDDGWAEGDVSYSGLVYDTFGYNHSGRASGVGNHGQQAFRAPGVTRGAMNRHTIQVRGDKVRLLINGHLVHESISPAGAAPWLALYSHRARDPVYRNFEITGDPVIPRQVDLCSDPSLRGWVASFYGQSRSNPFAAAGKEQAAAAPNLDWSLADGVLRGRRVAASLPGASPSRLYYYRPLSGGESVSYEFYYQPGAAHVHPSLGRIAYLLTESGAGLHWIADSESGDWTGLPVDHFVPHGAGDETASLPLKKRAWNQVKISLADGEVTITLNGAEALRRPLEEGQQTQFGFFHYRDQTAAQVRNVILQGDWPEKLTIDTLASLAAPQQEARNHMTGYTKLSMMEERRIATDAYNIYRRSLKMPPEERFEYLRDWVMPTKDHFHMRLYGDFTPGHPAPPAVTLPVDVQQAENLPDGAERAQTGGNLVAPVYELIDVAVELGRLEEIQDTAERALKQSRANRRAAPCMLAMIHLARGEYEQADQHLKRALDELKTTTQFYASIRWVEVVTAHRAAQYEQTRPLAMETLEWIIDEQIQKGRDKPLDWAHKTRHIYALAKWRSLPKESRRPFGLSYRDGAWHGATHTTARRRGEGYPPSHWRREDGGLKHYPGHDSDWVYYGSPIVGDFELNCEMTTFGWRDMTANAAGEWLTLVHNREEFEVANFGRTKPRKKIDPPLPELGDWYRYRLTIKNSVATSHVNGHQIYQRTIPLGADPWIGFRTNVDFFGGVRNVTLSGSPQIPDEVRLSDGAELGSWMASYYGESMSGENPAWKKDGDEIVGRRAANLPDGAVKQSLLQYHRPLFEDGAIEYEFYYEAGKVTVHPALDRLALVLDPGGVKVHWLTDAQFDRTGLPPDNLHDEPSIRRGQSPLPLKEKEWNRARLEITGNELSLHLNGEEVCRRAIEPTNLRMFGFYHDAAKTSCRMRSVVHRGAWPKELPPPQDGAHVLLSAEEKKANVAP